MEFPAYVVAWIINTVDHTVNAFPHKVLTPSDVYEITRPIVCQDLKYPTICKRAFVALKRMSRTRGGVFRLAIMRESARFLNSACRQTRPSGGMSRCFVTLMQRRCGWGDLKLRNS